MITKFKFKGKVDGYTYIIEITRKTSEAGHHYDDVIVTVKRRFRTLGVFYPHSVDYVLSTILFRSENNYHLHFQKKRAQETFNREFGGDVHG